MANSIDDVIRVYEKRHGLRVNSEQIEFLKRQQRKHRYDLNYRTHHNGARNPFLYLNVMVDKLLLFSYLTGEIPIIAGYKGKIKKKKIRSIKDLYLLRQAEIGTSGKGENHYARSKLITDKRLYKLVKRIQNRKHSFGLPNWGGHIDELGKDKRVSEYLGQKIDHKIVWRCNSPNILTFSCGGDRYHSGEKKTG